MRVLCDSNIFISYLLHAQADSPIRQLMDAATSRTFTLLLPGALLDEFVIRRHDRQTPDNDENVGRTVSPTGLFCHRSD